MSYDQILDTVTALGTLAVPIVLTVATQRWQKRTQAASMPSQNFGAMLRPLKTGSGNELRMHAHIATVRLDVKLQGCSN